MKALSTQQEKIMQFIREFKKNNDCAPTVYEIAEFLRIRPSTAFAHIDALQKKNMICRSSQARSIRLVSNDYKNNTCFHIPLLEHFCDLDFNCKTSQYVCYNLPKKHEPLQNELCALKTNNEIDDVISNGDIVILKVAT